MKMQNNDYAHILENFVSGFRRYDLNELIRPVYISRNLCDMLGYTPEELSCEKSDAYMGLVHPADKHIYEELLKNCATDKKACSAEYRLIKSDGTVMYVKDTVNVECADDGCCFGYAVLTDISAVKSENENLRFLNETVPCGMLKYTCEKNPRITYINKKMAELLRIPESRSGELDYLDMYKDNIYLAIPFEYRKKFDKFLNKVYVNDEPLSGEITALRCDGTRARLFGWITRATNADGTEEFQSVCMDITDKYNQKRMGETERYIKAVCDVYDKIFEYDLLNKTVKYVFGKTDTFERMRNIPMQMEDATEEWIKHQVCAEDRDRMREFFGEFFARRYTGADGKPLYIEYGFIAQDESVQKYQGVFLNISTNVALFCCKKLQDMQTLENIINENASLKSRAENMQEVVMRYTDGLAAFEVTNDCITPLYSSDNVCEFFGFSKEEWLVLMRERTTLKEFVLRSAVDYQKFRELLNTGEAEFSYYDIASGSEKRIKAICSQRHSDPDTPRFVLLYKLDVAGKNTDEENSPKIYIRTFGYFDVFVDEKPILFRNKKAKELLALLVDRRGGFVSSEEAIGYLWEDESVNTVTLARYRKEALRLKNMLEEYGIGDIMESVDGKRRIVPERVKCDLFDYLSRQEEFAGLFKGSYLTNYAWGEMTLGELMSENFD